MYSALLCHHRLLLILLLSSQDPGPAQEEGSQKKLTTGPQRLKKIRLFDLSSVVRPLAPDHQQQLSLEAFRRILAAESKLRGGDERGGRSLSYSIFMYIILHNVMNIVISFQRLQHMEVPVR